MTQTLTQTLPAFLDLAAIATAGLFGSAIAVKRRMPIVGVMMIGVLSALGGGMLRDILMGVQVVAMHDDLYLPTAIGAALLGIPLARRIVEHAWIGLILDGAVLGLFTLVGAQKAALAGLPFAACVFIGLTTSIGGGTIVELMVGQPPTIIEHGPWFATAALVGCFTTVALLGRVPDGITAAATVAVVAGLRITSVKLDFAAPSVKTLQKLRRQR